MQVRLPSDACLRPWRAGDESSLVHHGNDRDIWRNLRDAFPHPYTVEHARAWVAFASAHTPPTQVAIEVEGEAAGGVGLMLKEDIHRRTAEIGFWLGRRHWGRGIGSAAVAAFSAYAFETFDVVRLEAGVIEWNPGSARVLEKAGFAFEGRHRHAVFKDGVVADELVFARLRAPRADSRRA